ncbi:Rho-GTPase-activating protein 8 [Basidiobolus ranarum]|uniref:Rho-GTPase-activating protein 8 n=1 Tax=Basidiobolus ranarum TaxID=34480 RepID=A0ABR2VSF7_9FUNG
MKNTKETIDLALKRLDKQRTELLRTQEIYMSKCGLADSLEKQEADKPSRRLSIQDLQLRLELITNTLGTLSFTEEEFKEFLQRIQTEIKTQEVRYPFLGLYKGLVSGESIAEWLRVHYNLETEEQVEQVGQGLIDQGFMKFIGRGNKFTVKPNSFYQWKKLYQDQGSPLEKARLEAEETDATYKVLAKTVDKSRMSTERALMSYLGSMENNEMNRIVAIKAAFLSFAATFSNVVSTHISMAERTQLYFETLKPENDITFMIEQYGTGYFHPKPVVYENFYYGSVKDQIYGVPLEEQARLSKNHIPLIITKCLSALTKGYGDMSYVERRDIWIARVPLTTVHSLKRSINQGCQVTLKQLRGYDLKSIVGALKLYLLELPECLCTSELYDAVKAIYAPVPIPDKDDEEERARLSSLQNLLTALPSANKRCLKAIMSHLNQLLQDLSSEEPFLPEICHNLGHILLRPHVETPVTFHDRHPQKFVKDMICHYQDIFESMNLTNISYDDNESSDPNAEVVKPSSSLNDEEEDESELLFSDPSSDLDRESFNSPEPSAEISESAVELKDVSQTPRVEPIELDSIDDSSAPSTTKDHIPKSDEKVIVAETEKVEANETPVEQPEQSTEPSKVNADQKDTVNIPLDSPTIEVDRSIPSPLSPPPKPAVDKVDDDDLDPFFQDEED